LPRQAQELSRELLRAMLKMQRGGDRPLFAVPDHLARKWDLPSAG
jgi:hypothetical protein